MEKLPISQETLVYTPSVGGTIIFSWLRGKAKEKAVSMKKIYSVLVIIFLVVGASCSRNTNAAVGASQKSEIKRIISAAPSNTEILIGLGLADRLIAIDPYSSDIEGVPAGLPQIDFFYPDTEAIIALEPELILVNEVNSYGVADNPFTLLGNMGIRVTSIPTSVSIEGIYEDIIFVAETLGVREQGEAVAASMKNEIESIAAAGEKLPEKKSVYFEVSGAPYMVTFGRDTYLNEMIEIAGGRNIFSDQTNWFSPSAEEIINRNPDVILTFQYSDEDPVQEILNREAFESITAVKQKQVFVIDANSASRPSQNILTALREMTRIIDPSYYESAR